MLFESCSQYEFPENLVSTCNPDCFLIDIYGQAYLTDWLDYSEVIFIPD
jgi:hypothetical protein